MWSWKTRARHKPLRIFLHTQRQPSRRCRSRDNTRTTCASEDPFHFYHEDILLEWNSSYTIDTPITIIQVPCRCLIFSLLIIPQEYIFLYFTLSRLSPKNIYVLRSISSMLPGVRVFISVLSVNAPYWLPKVWSWGAHIHGGILVCF